jgi:hypothetical protein
MDAPIKCEHARKFWVEAQSWMDFRCQVCIVVRIMILLCDSTTLRPILSQTIQQFCLVESKILRFQKLRSYGLRSYIEVPILFRITILITFIHSVGHEISRDSRFSDFDRAKSYVGDLEFEK